MEVIWQASWMKVVNVMSFLEVQEMDFPVIVVLEEFLDSAQVLEVTMQGGVLMNEEVTMQGDVSMVMEVNLQD